MAGGRPCDCQPASYNEWLQILQLPGQCMLDHQVCILGVPYTQSL